jgi:predicted amidophosphoribosyltransferase
MQIECKYPDLHRSHIEVGPHACLRCVRTISWALEFCWDCNEAIKKESRLRSVKKGLAA